MATKRNKSPDGVQEDVLIYPLLVDLVGCLAAEFSAAGLGDVEPVLVIGNEYALEINCNGAQVWVRLSNAYPTLTVPIISTDPVAGGTPMALGFLIEVGAARCIPDDGRNPMTPAEYLQAARYQAADMAAMRRAICACVLPTERDLVFTDYQPVGPLGDMVWGTWQVNIGMP